MKIKVREPWSKVIKKETEGIRCWAAGSISSGQDWRVWRRIRVTSLKVPSMLGKFFLLLGVTNKADTQGGTKRSNTWYCQGQIVIASSEAPTHLWSLTRRIWRQAVPAVYTNGPVWYKVGWQLWHIMYVVCSLIRLWLWQIELTNGLGVLAFRVLLADANPFIGQDWQCWWLLVRADKTDSLT